MTSKSPLKIERVSIDDALQTMHDAVFVDARSATALSRNPLQVRGAIHVPVKEVEQRLRQLPRDRTLITYCT
jgi:rhodanese-related sulfurtransferase